LRWMLTVSTEPVTEEIKHGRVIRPCLFMSENLQVTQRKKKGGNPNWLPGVSGNPGGKTKARMELQASIEKIHAGPLALQALDRLRRIGMGITTFGLRQLPAEDKVQVAALVAYLDRVGAHVPKRKEEDEKPLADLTAEEMDELAQELARKAEAKRGEIS